MQNIDRILDANANRAREALRVMEETARFVLNDTSLSTTLKTARHDLAAAVTLLGPIINQRNTAADVGTTITGPGEYKRQSIHAVTLAAAKRLSEALRCLEEYGKLRHDAPTFVRRIENLRYRGYDIEKTLTAALTKQRAPQWRVCVLITESLCAHHSWLDVAEASLAGGADCLQLREKNIDSRELLHRAQQLLELTHNAKHASLIINDRADIALAAGAHGLHVGQSDLPISAIRQINTTHPPLWIGASTHNLTEAKNAIRDGADYCGVGAMYPTSTKQRKPSGLTYLKRFIRDFPDIPHLAIGGITPHNAPQLAEAGAQGLAVSSIVCGAKKPATVVRQLKRAFK